MLPIGGTLIPDSSCNMTKHSFHPKCPQFPPMRVWVLIGLIVLNIDVFLDDGSGRGFPFNVEHVDEVCVAGV